MTVPVEFEDGLLQNNAIFDYLEEVKKKVPDVVQDTATKKALMDLKKELLSNITEIDISEKKQIDELIQVFHDKNFDVWKVRSDLANLADKIVKVNRDFDERRRRESFDAIDLFVRQTNVIYQLTGTRWELTAGRFSSVDALTTKGDLKKSIEDKIVSAALQAKENIEQEELLEAARIAKVEKGRVLAEKEKELKQREADIARRETSDVQAMQAQIEQERANAAAKTNALRNIQSTNEDKKLEIIGRLTDLENNIDPEKAYSGKSVLKMVQKIKEMLK